MGIKNITSAEAARIKMNELKGIVAEDEEYMKRMLIKGRSKLRMARIKEDNASAFGYDTLRVIFSQWFDKSADREIRRMAYDHIESDVRLRNKQYDADMKMVKELREEAEMCMTEYRIAETRVKIHNKTIMRLSAMIKEMENDNQGGMNIFKD